MPNYLDPNMISNLINQVLTQQNASKYSQGFSLAQPQSGGFSLAGPKQEPFTTPIKALSGGKKTNWPDMLKGMTVAIGSTLNLLKDRRPQAPAATVGQRYPAQIQISYPERPLGFKSILGGK